MGEATLARAGASSSRPRARRSTAWARTRTASMNYAGRDVDMYQLNTVDVVPFLVVQPRLRPAVGQHVAHAVRRPEASPCTCRRATSTTPSGRPGGLTGTYRQGDCATGTVVATRVDAADRVRRARGPAAPSRRSTRPPQATNPQIHPKLKRGRGLRRLGRRRSRARPPATTTSLTFANNGVRLWLDGQLLRRHLAAGLAALVGRGARCTSARGSATRSASSGGARTTRPRCASSGRRRRAARTRRSGRRSATASTTTSSTAPTSTTWSRATAS